MRGDGKNRRLKEKTGKNREAEENRRSIKNKESVKNRGLRISGRKNKTGSLKGYHALLTGIFLVASCFTLLYFFVFTDSYSLFRNGDSGSDSYLIREVREAVISSADRNHDGSVLQEQTEKKAGQQEHNKKKLLPCGIPVGIYLETRGVLVTELADLVTASGDTISPCDGILEPGDYILRVGKTEISDKEQFRELIQKSDGQKLELLIERNGEQQQAAVTPVLSEEGEYAVGIWIRDDMHGIGTLTWLDEDGNFAALGHCISDIDTGRRMEIDTGQLYHAEIYSLIRSSSNKPGSLSGAIDYRLQSCIGTVEANTEQGIFGSGNEGIETLILDRLNSCYRQNTFENLWEKAAMETASADEIKDGKAQMLSCFSGEYQLYDIEIRRIQGEKAGYDNINLEITVTDDSLLKQTGGILQGMSGSPILQDGRLVGAVTHVLVNDPTRGYGIFIENMLEH
ncbi:MAG: SpoIVB peptidase S55 domain-containing protein [Lachnospiraceae bacterium]|nr:SpoIVB peptidase S55 domain-containing protein [Lachnospiraceae bacterium]